VRLQVTSALEQDGKRLLLFAVEFLLKVESRILFNLKNKVMLKKETQQTQKVFY